MAESRWQDRLSAAEQRIDDTQGAFVRAMDAFGAALSQLELPKGAEERLLELEQQCSRSAEQFGASVREGLAVLHDAVRQHPWRERRTRSHAAFLAPAFAAHTEAIIDALTDAVTGAINEMLEGDI